MMVEEWNRYGGREEQWISGLVEQRWWNCGTEIVDQWNNDGGTVMVEQRNNYGVTVQERWWTSGTMIVE